MRQLEKRDNVFVSRGSSVERRKNGHAARLHKHQAACSVARLGEVVDVDSVESGRKFARGGGISVLLGVSSLAYCYISEIRQAVVRRPPRENVKSKIRLAISVLFTVI